MIQLELIFAGLLMFCTQGECSSGANPMEANVFFVNTDATSLACQRPYCERERSGFRLQCAGDLMCSTDTAESTVCNGGALACSAQGYLVCSNGELPCASGVPVCSEPQPRCSALDGEELTRHRPLIVFAYHDLIEQHPSVNFEVVLTPEGEELALLEPLDLCLELVTNPAGMVSYEPGYVRKARRPSDQVNLDPAGYGWMSKIAEFDYRFYGPRTELRQDNPSKWGNYAVAKIRLDEGLLLSAKHKQTEGEYDLWQACPSDLRRPATKENLPRSMPERVSFMVGTSLDFIGLMNCGGEMLLKLQPNQGTRLRLSFLNLPYTSHGSAGSASHFRWYYELLKCGPGLNCHEGRLPIPTRVEEEESPCPAVGTGNLFCPPTTYP